MNIIWNVNILSAQRERLLWNSDEIKFLTRYIRVSFHPSFSAIALFVAQKKLLSTSSSPRGVQVAAMAFIGCAGRAFIGVHTWECLLALAGTLEGLHLCIPCLFSQDCLWIQVHEQVLPNYTKSFTLWSSCRVRMDRPLPTSGIMRLHDLPEACGML